MYLKNLKKISFAFLFLTAFTILFDINAYGATKRKVQLATGENHSLILNSNGTIYSWGANNFGQLGNSTEIDSLKPTPVEDKFGDEDIISVAAGAFHSIALSDDGNLWAWGWNMYGQLGDGSQKNRNTPKKINSISKVKAVSAGYSHTIALKDDGTVWAWGQNDSGQLGNNSTKDSSYPVQVYGLKNIVSISANGKHNLALDSDGNIWFWGENWGGQLGELFSSIKIPRALTLPKDNDGNNLVPAYISAGKYHCIALMFDGSVWTWGFNPFNDLDSSTSNPVKVEGLDNVIRISAGNDYNLALKRDGSLWAWGLNGFGQLGNGTKEDSSTPKLVAISNNIDSICAGNSFNLALDKNENFFSWGLNKYGQLGDETTENRTTPVLLNLTAVKGISLNEKKITVSVGSSYRLFATITPRNASNTDVVWSSSKSYIASVDDTGKVTAHSPGTTTITVKTLDGGYTSSCEVTVPVPVSGISLSKSSITLILNKTYFDTDTIHATIYPSNADNKEIIWSSSNPNVVSVDSKGVVRAVSPGKAVITAKTKDGNHKDTVDVTVTDEGLSEWKTIKMLYPVDINKNWRIKFSLPLYYKTVTEENIYIKDEYGNKIDTELYFVDESNNISSVNSNITASSVLIIPKSTYVKGRTYYLYIDNDLQSKKNKTFLKQRMKIEFKVKEN